MYPLFISVSLLILFESTSQVDIASDKETIKKTLVQVDKFLERVGQNIQHEIDYIKTLGKKQSEPPTTVEKLEAGVSNEYYDNFWFGANKKDTFSTTKTDYSEMIFRVHHNNGDDTTMTNKKHSNFIKALASLNFNKMDMGSTKKLSHAIFDLKGLVKNDIHVKSERNLDKATNDIFRQIQEKLSGDNVNRKENTGNSKETSRKSFPKIVRKNYAKAREEDEEGDDSDFDIFRQMDFPTRSEFPITVSLITSETTPAILKPDFIEKVVESGPQEKVLHTPSTTTDIGELLLNPSDFGLTTTRKHIATFGDISALPHIDPKYFTTTTEPPEYKLGFEQLMAKHDMGVFSIAMMKMFELAMFKKPELLRRLAWGFGRLIEGYSTQGFLDYLGQPTRHALVESTGTISEMTTDELKAQGIVLHNSVIHRRDIFSKDVNSILDHIDSLYVKEETDNLINSMNALDKFNNDTIVPYTLIKNFVDNTLAPWVRLKGTPKEAILKEAISRGLRNHFYPTEEYLSRRNEQVNLKSSNDELNKPSRKKMNGVRYRKVKKFNSIELRNVNSRAEQANLNRRPYNGGDNLKAAQFNWKPKVIYEINENFGKDVQNASVHWNPRANTVKSLNVKETNASRNNGVGPKYDIKVIKMQNIFTEPPKPNNDGNVNNVNNKRVVLINKKDQDTVLLNQGLEMSSHKKRHHKKHKHKHRSTKHKLSRILKLIKNHKHSHKKRKHRKHHHRHNRHNTNLRAEIDKDDPKPSHTTNKETIKLTVPKAKEDRLQDVKTEPTKYLIPTDSFYAFTTQVYEMKNLNFRRDLKSEKLRNTVNVIRQVTSESDDEIPSKINLYKAMGLGNNEIKSNGLRDVKKALLKGSSASCESEEEFLKNKIYNYFRNTHDT